MNASAARDHGGARLRAAAAYVAGFALMAVAVAARMALDPWLGDRLPFVTLFPAVVLATWIGGRWVGLAGALVGGLGATYLVVQPRFRLDVVEAELRYGLGAYAVVAAVIVLTVDALGAARRRAEEEIVARIAAEKILADREELLRITFSSIGDAVVTTDAAGNVLTLNAEARTLTGWTQEEARGRPLSEVFVIVNERTRLPVESPVEKVLREGSVVGLANHTVLIAKDGAERPIDDSAAPIRDVEGRMMGVVLIFRDIGERRRAEDELSRGEERFRLAAEAVDGLIYEYDFVSGRVERTRGLREMLGFRPDEIPSTAEWWAERIHPDDRGRVLAVDPSRITTSKVVMEYRVRHRDGRWLHVEDRAVLLRDEAGAPVKLVGCAVDVTARARAAEALAEQERRLRLVTNGAPVMIAHCGADRRYKFVNETYASRFGLTPGEVDGMHLAEVVGEAAYESFRKHVDEVLAGRPVEFETEIPYRFGGSRFMHVAYTPERDADGDVVGLVAAIVDITDRKRTEERLSRSEERFRTMANSTPAMIWTAAPDGTITFHNQRWLEYTGVSPEENARDWPTKVLHPDDLDRCVRQWTEALRDGTDYEIEVRNRRRDGEYRWFLTRAAPIRDASGRIVEWYGSTTDIHDRKLAEEALKEADRRKDEFLATLAHELRNPLAPARNSLELMKRAGGDLGAIDRARSTVERQIGQMVRLIDDLLDVSRITRDKLVLRMETTDLASVVRHAVESCRAQCDEAGHELAVDLPAEPILLTADPARLAQVLGNLLSNSCKYTEPGGRIRLSAERVDGEVRVVVSDTGVGIPSEMLPRVFDLFTQVDRSLERAQGGLGIGLSLVKRLVEMHGGVVTARSDGLGNGSEFIVSLPVRAETAADGPPLPEAASVEAAPPNRGRRILVVDDGRDSAESLAMLLKLLGYEAATAHDGLEAVERAESFRPDAILLDIGLPKLNGYEACRRIRSTPRGADILVIALTGWGQEDDRRKSKQAGFDGHLVKPVDLDDLLRILEEPEEASPREVDSARPERSPA